MKVRPRLTLQLLRIACFVHVLAAPIMLPFSAYAEKPDFEAGVGEFQQQHFGKAAGIFEQCIASGSKTEDVYYYAAISYEHLGNYKKAYEDYKYVTEHFPNTQAGLMASAALQRPAFQQIIFSHGINQLSRPPGLDTYPKETWVPFVRNSNSVVVDGAINNVPTKMIFDTGASNCVFSFEQLEKLGVQAPKGKPNTMSYGVGSSKQVAAWLMTADLRLGNIERKKFPIMVTQTAIAYPLLGENFYHDLKYTIDKDASSIMFQYSGQKSKSDSNTRPVSGMTVSSTGNYVYNVPFSIENRALIVVANLNGRQCPMIFDTGADICMFTTDVLNQLKVKPISTGKTMNVKGSSGMAQAQLCVIEKAQLGPISGPMPCLVTDQAMVPRPLLGQSFFKDWLYTIDQANHVIQFVRRQ